MVQNLYLALGVRPHDDAVGVEAACLVQEWTIERVTTDAAPTVVGRTVLALYMRKIILNSCPDDLSTKTLHVILFYI